MSNSEYKPETEKLRIIFFGTPQFAVPFLETLHKNTVPHPSNIQYEIAAVIAQPDAPTGRKQIMTAPPIAEYAKKHNIPLLQPESLRDNDEFKKQFTALNAAACIVIAYGKILPSWILETYDNAVINVHPSLLPKYRGPSPMQAALRNGDTETGITIMLMDVKMDHGPILTQRKIPLSNDMTLYDLEEIVHREGAKELAHAVIHFLHERKIKPQPQNHSEATYCKLLTRTDGYIAPKDSLETIRQKWRAYYPWPGVTFALENGKKYKLHTVGSISQDNASARLELHGKNTSLNLTNKEGALKIMSIQEEGRTPMSAEEFIRGLPSQQIHEKLKEMS